MFDTKPKQYRLKRVCITFPKAEGLLIDRWAGYSLNNFKQHILRRAPELLDNPINSLSILKVDVIIWMFCFASSMTLKFICIDHLENQIIGPLSQLIVHKIPIMGVFV